MDRAQRQAIVTLERALKKCRESDLAIYGMDSSLLVVAREDVTVGGVVSPISEATHVLGQDIVVNIETHGAYIDSGGW